MPKNQKTDQIIDLKISCPKCKKSSTYPLWTAVDTEERPETNLTCPWCAAYFVAHAVVEVDLKLETLKPTKQ